MNLIMSDDKIQIVAFSTNDTDKNPNHIINTFLEQQNHVILKKTRNTIAFSTTLEGSSKSKTSRIMICSILNLEREYTGITDVNCYLVFIDLENEASKEKFDSILSYMKDYCEITKKIFVFGMINVNKNEENENSKNYKDEIMTTLKNSELTYEYKDLDLSNTKEIFNEIMNVLVYSSKNAISGKIEEDLEKGQSGSCNII